jgi:thymidine kinase
MLTVITGPMFAGKTTYLINFVIANMKVGRCVMCYKPAKDNRYADDAIKTHNGGIYPAAPIQSPLEALMQLKDALKVGVKTDLIGFDEAQFFDPTHMQATVSELLNSKVDVVIAGLAQNSFGEPFGAMGSLMAMADEVVQLPAICAKCKVNKATRTYRKCASTDRVLVGGSEDYEPRCYKCWSNK